MGRRYYSYELDTLVRQLKFVPYRIKKYGAVKERGKVYWSGHWGQWYEVIRINGNSCTIKWDDGCIETGSNISINYHKNYELRAFEYKKGEDVFERSFTGAEIKALCCAGAIDDIIADEIFDRYFSVHTRSRINDNAYYNICPQRVTNGAVRILLKRDLGKSPRKRKEDEK